MFQISYILLIFLNGFNLCSSFESFNDVLRILENGNRERALVANVTALENVEIPSNVIKWTSLTIGLKSYSVGITTNNSLVLLCLSLAEDSDEFISKQNIIDLNNGEISDVLLMESILNGKVSVFLTVAFQNKPHIIWFKINNLSLEQFSLWTLKRSVAHLNMFKIKNKHHLLVGYVQKQNDTTVDIYSYQIQPKTIEFWFQQHLPLSFPVKSSAFNYFVNNHFLSVVQQELELVVIFKYTENRFENFQNISSYDVTHVVPFQIDFKSFIGLDGFDAGIYRFTKNSLVKTVSDTNLDGIKFGLPIPFETYREDLILLTERQLDHDSYKSVVFKLMSFNGQGFDEHEDIPCHYYGEESNGLTCLHIENYTTDLTGASIVHIEDKLALLIPQRKAVYALNYYMADVPNPLVKSMKMYLDRKEKLEKILEAQAQAYEELENRNSDSNHFSSRISEEPSSEIVTERVLEDSQISPEEIDALFKDLQILGKNINGMEKKLKTSRDFLNGHHTGTIVFNGPVIVEEAIKCNKAQTLQLNGEPATELLEDIVSMENIKDRSIKGQKTFSDIVIENVFVEKLDEIDADQLLFLTNTPLTVHGDVVFEGIVNAQNVDVTTGAINDVFLDKEIVDMRKKYNDTLTFEHVKIDGDLNSIKMNNLEMDLLSTKINNLDKVFIPHNITVTNVNGESLDNLIKALCLRNIKCYIPGEVTINGDVQIISEAYTDFLNNVQFPEEFLLRDSEPNVKITGRKTFTGALTAEQITSPGLVGEVNMDELVTLSTPQNIPTTAKFNDLEVSVELNVTRNILGDFVNKFVPNPTILESDEIESNLIFKYLEVDGSVTILNDLQGENFELQLKDIAYKDEDIITIPSMKNFPLGFTVRRNLNLKSESINTIPLATFVTKDSEQTLDIEQLNGVINIENLHVGGTFSNINITKLDEECVKTSGEQFISSTLIFNDRLVVKNLEIDENLNDVNYEGYLYISGDDKEIDNHLEFNQIFVENLLVEGNYEGVIEDFDLREFEDRMMSKTKDQTIPEAYVVRNSHIRDLNASFINNRFSDDLFNYPKILDKIQGIVQDKKTRFVNLHINGSLNAKSLNGRNFHDISFENMLKSDGLQVNQTVTFQDVHFENLQIKNLSEIKFDEIMSRIVFKNETNVKFSAQKEFLSGITVEKLIETSRINEIEVDNILTKQGVQDIKGSIIIHGDVHFDSNVSLLEVNDFPVDYITENFMLTNGVYIIRGDVMFNRMMYIGLLAINGFSNNKFTQDFIDNLAYTDTETVFSEKITFDSKVSAGNMAVINEMNGVNLTDILPRIVLRTTDSTIKGLVTFKQPVYIKRNLKVNGNMETHLLDGVNIRTWIDKAVFCNKGLLPGYYTFEEIVVNESLTTDFINDINWSSVIPLRDLQEIDSLTLERMTMVNNMPVANSVNGYNLSQEMDNTVMNDIEQEITSDIIFSNNILVRQHLNATKLNNLDTSKVVMTNTKQNLTASYNFDSKTAVDNNLNVSRSINGFDVSAWSRNGVKVSHPTDQNVYDTWMVKGNVTFKEDVNGTGLIDGMSLIAVQGEVEERRKNRNIVEQGFITDYKHICQDLNNLYNSAKKQIYKFKYFADFQDLKFTSFLESAHFLKVRHDNYLLVQEHESCDSHLLVFQNSKFTPLKLVTTGILHQVITVYDGDFVYLVSNSKEASNCEVQGTNVWKFDSDESLEIIANIPNQDILQDSLIPGTFYGLDQQGVTEFRVLSLETAVKKFRKWELNTDNSDFIPRGLGTGLALRTGRKLIRLIRDGSETPEENNSLDTEITLRGVIAEEFNSFLPGRNDGHLVVLTVGVESSIRRLLAVAIHEETNVRNRLDMIKIYEDAETGRLFQKIPTYKPTNLLSINLDNGETLFVFMENGKTLQIYEYKGIEGFKFRNSAKLKEPKDIFLMSLPRTVNITTERQHLGVVTKNQLSIIETVMTGNKIRNDLHCGL